MIIWQKQKAVFFHNPRTGGNSIHTAMGIKQVDTPMQHWTTHRAKRWIFQETWNDYWSFAFVRNPWERYVSMWAHATWNLQSPLAKSNSSSEAAPQYQFDEWVYLLRNKFISYGAAEYPQHYWTEDCTEIFRFEERTQVLPYISAKIELNLQDVHTNQSKHGPYAEYYRKKSTIETVREIDKKTINHFGYKFGD
jgi:hypothetical protein